MAVLRIYPKRYAVHDCGSPEIFSEHANEVNGSRVLRRGLLLRLCLRRPGAWQTEPGCSSTLLFVNHSAWSWPGQTGSAAAIMNTIHIGQVIKQKLDESQLSVTDFANRIHRTRSTVYDIFTRKSIDTDLLLKISEVLRYNFLEEVYLKKHDKKEPSKFFLAVEIEEAELPETWVETRLSVLKKVTGEK